VAAPTAGLHFDADMLARLADLGVRPENLGAEPQWHDLAAVVDLPDGEVSFAEAAGRSLYIYRQGEDFRVYDSRCPHQETNIPHLALEHGRLTCPKHHWAFDITTGECVEVGNRPLRRFDHKVEEGRLLAHW
jgi:nitrite reductase/ring-hydroxylating ferredoxin subunit